MKTYERALRLMNESEQADHQVTELHADIRFLEQLIEDMAPAEPAWDILGYGSPETIEKWTKHWSEGQAMVAERKAKMREAHVGDEVAQLWGVPLIKAHAGENLWVVAP